MKGSFIRKAVPPARMGLDPSKAHLLVQRLYDRVWSGQISYEPQQVELSRDGW